MNQITIYRNGEKWANVIVPDNPMFMQNVAQVPSDVMYTIRNWARGIGMVQSSGVWSWEWQQRGK